jgi:MFS family permease
MLTLWRATTAPQFLTAAILEGSASGTIFPMIITLMSDRCLPHERGRFFSLSVGGLDFGMIMAGPIMGSSLIAFCPRQIQGYLFSE